MGGFYRCLGYSRVLKNWDLLHDNDSDILNWAAGQDGGRIASNSHYYWLAHSI